MPFNLSVGVCLCMYMYILSMTYLVCSETLSTLNFATGIIHKSSGCSDKKRHVITTLFFSMKTPKTI